MTIGEEMRMSNVEVIRVLTLVGGVVTILALFGLAGSLCSVFVEIKGFRE